MVELTKTKKGWLVLCLTVVMLLAFALPAFAIPVPVSFAPPGPGYDADKVFFAGDSFTVTLNGFGVDATETRVAFGVVGQNNTFVSAKVLSECTTTDGGVDNFITATPVGGQIAITGTVASDLPSGFIAVKFYRQVGETWVDQTQAMLQSMWGDGQDFLPLSSMGEEAEDAIVGLDSIFSVLPQEPDETTGTNFWVRNDKGGPITDQRNNLYDSGATFNMVIADEDGKYSTGADTTFGMIYLASLNFMDQELMASLSVLFDNITMEKQDAKSLDGFTIGLNTQQLTCLANMDAVISITSPYFEEKKLTVDSFKVVGDGTVSSSEFTIDADEDGEVDTFMFAVDHFSNYNVELTYNFSSTVYADVAKTIPLPGATINLLDRYLEPVPGLTAQSGADGNIEISNIPGGQYYAQCLCDGYILRLSELIDTALVGNASGSVAMDRLYPVTFTITDWADNPLEGAQIVLGQYQGINAVTGANGQVTTEAVTGASYKVVKEGYKTVSGTLGSPVVDQSKKLQKLTYLTLTANKTHDIAFEEEVIFTATLKDANGVGIAEKDISFTGYIGSGIETVPAVTNSNGQAVFSVAVGGHPEGASYYEYRIEFLGDDVCQGADPFYTTVIIGIPATPVPITTAEELAAIDHSDSSAAGNYILANDIDLAKYIGDNSGDWDPISHFCGSFDGNKKKITGLSGQYPLFDNIGAPAVIKDFNIVVTPGTLQKDFDNSGIFARILGSKDKGPILIENINISGSTCNNNSETQTPAGFAVEVYGKAVIKNCHVDVDITLAQHDKAYFGGFIGFSGGDGSNTSPNTEILIQNCSFTGSINGGDGNTPIASECYTTWGGFVGDNNIGSTVENCFADVDLYFVTDGEDVRAGGFAGRNAGTIKGSYATGNIRFTNDYSYISNIEDTFAGGFVGRNVGSIENCFANMALDVTANYGATLGGFAGSDTAKSLTNCYATGTITATADNPEDLYIGGLIGSAQTNSSFWNWDREDLGYEPALFVNLDNSYYDSSLSHVGIGAILNYDRYQFYLVKDRANEAVQKTAAAMKTKAFAAILNDQQSPAVWNSSVSSRVNEGYPVLAWVNVPAPVSSGGSSLATYTVRFESNGGSQVKSISDIPAGATIDQPADPTKEGYQFAGWYTDSALTTPFDFLSQINKDRTLYAKWTATATETPAGASKHFSDVTEDNYSWAVAAIDALYEDGVIGGIGDGQYGPSQDIKRGDFILMLVRAFDLSGTPGDNFSDVTSGSYYQEAIAIAKSLGIAKGDGNSNSFMPQGSLSRQDAMVLVYRVFQMKGKTLAAGSAADLAGFTDGAKVSDYALEAVSALVKAGVMKGDGANLNPQATMNRAEMAVILYRLLQL